MHACTSVKGFKHVKRQILQVVVAGSTPLAAKSIIPFAKVASRTYTKKRIVQEAPVRATCGGEPSSHYCFGGSNFFLLLHFCLVCSSERLISKSLAE